MVAGSYIRLGVALLCPAGWLAHAQAPPAGGPRPETAEAFARYIRLAESRLEARLRGPETFLWADSAELRARVRSAGVVCEPRNRKGDTKVSHGLIHDWIGAAFIPGATLNQVMKLVQDYDDHKKTYGHEVIDSRILERNGNDFRVYLRLLKRKVITVVLDTEHEVHYRQLDALSWSSQSHSTRITEIRNPGGPGERAVPAGQDHGFLWRLNSYWTFHEKDSGVYVECEAISLSRSVPQSIAWLIDPIVRSLPREALANTLRATRSALLQPAAAAP